LSRDWESPLPEPSRHRNSLKGSGLLPADDPLEKERI
jgi:hypothetical protein